MATTTDDESQITNEFQSLHRFFTELKATYFKDCDTFKEISMGMSHDYPLAVECGATMVRVGSLIFGRRGLKKPVL